LRLQTQIYLNSKFDLQNTTTMFAQH